MRPVGMTRRRQRAGRCQRRRLRRPRWRRLWRGRRRRSGHGRGRGRRRGHGRRKAVPGGMHDHLAQLGHASTGVGRDQDDVGNSARSLRDLLISPAQLSTRRTRRAPIISDRQCHCAARTQAGRTCCTNTARRARSAGSTRSHLVRTIWYLTDTLASPVRTPHTGQRHGAVREQTQSCGPRW